jgi:hypothetical protein
MKALIPYAAGKQSNLGLGSDSIHLLSSGSDSSRMYGWTFTREKEVEKELQIPDPEGPDSVSPYQSPNAHVGMMTIPMRRHVLDLSIEAAVFPATDVCSISLFLDYSSLYELVDSHVWC